MEDNNIIDLYFQRSENAITETKIKYGRLIVSVSLGILKNIQDAEECESDTYMKTWYSIPPERPNIFSAFLSKIARNLSLDRYEYIHAQKRGGGEVPLLLDELAECIPDETDFDYKENEDGLKAILNNFLKNLKQDARVIFMRRYWFGDSIQEISDKYGYGQSKVKMSLMRSRKELKNQLKKEGMLYE